MPPEIIPDDEEYASSEDSDFAPETAAAPLSEDSADEESDADASSKDVKNQRRKPVKRKRGQDEDAEDVGFENSGDEAIIEKGLKRRRKKTDKYDDEGGEGGLVKTRSMRAQEKVEKKPLVDASAATVDVDSIWADMISGKIQAVKPTPAPEEEKSITQESTSTAPQAPQNERRSKSASGVNDGPDSMVLIKRTYNFAGKVHSEEKLVHPDSAEAKLYLANQANSKPAENEPASPFAKPKRPSKKARRSVFEPVLDIPPRKDLYLGVRKESDTSLLSPLERNAKKLNTVEKSAMDWAGFVDKEGIKDELHAAGKSKGAYKSRQEFLARVEQKKEEDLRRAKGLPV